MQRSKLIYNRIRSGRDISDVPLLKARILDGARYSDSSLPYLRNSDLQTACFSGLYDRPDAYRPGLRNAAALTFAG